MRQDLLQRKNWMSSSARCVQPAALVLVCILQTAWTVWLRYLEWDYRAMVRFLLYILNGSVSQNMREWKWWSFGKRISVHGTLWQKRRFWMPLLWIWRLDAPPTVCCISRQSHTRSVWILRLILLTASVKRRRISATWLRQARLTSKISTRREESTPWWRSWIRRDYYIQTAWLWPEKQ